MWREMLMAQICFFPVSARFAILAVTSLPRGVGLFSSLYFTFLVHLKHRIMAFFIGVDVD